MAPEINLADPAVRADLYPTYARLRKESPVVIIYQPLFGKTYSTP